MSPAGSKRWAWMVGLLFCLGADCSIHGNPLIGYVGPPAPYQEVDLDAERMAILVKAQVPEGRWPLSLSATPELVIERQTALGKGSIEPGACTEAPCDALIELECPRGKCEFAFEVSVQRTQWVEPLTLVGEYVFSEHAGGGGCSDRNPNYVEPSDRGNFFELAFQVQGVDGCEAVYTLPEDPDSNDSELECDELPRLP